MDEVELLLEVDEVDSLGDESESRLYECVCGRKTPDLKAAARSDSTKHLRACVLISLVCTFSGMFYTMLDLAK